MAVAQFKSIPFLETVTANEMSSTGTTSLLVPLVKGDNFTKTPEPSGILPYEVSTPRAGIATVSINNPVAFSNHTVSPPLDSPNPLLSPTKSAVSVIIT